MLFCSPLNPFNPKIEVIIMTSSTKTPMTADERNAWVPGFTPQAELWNGRFAMLGFVFALITELASNQGILHFWNLLNDTPIQ
jgi:Chlorophyll A-B binding protein